MRNFVGLMFVAMMATNAMASSSCTAPNQDGCFNIILFNGVFDGNYPEMQGLDHPARTLGEAQFRMNTVGPKVFMAFKQGTVHASHSRTYLAFFWGINKISPEDLGSYVSKLTSNGTAAAVSSPGDIEMIDPATIKLPSRIDGKIPDVIYRVHVNGSDKSVQFPWSETKEGFEYLLCQEDEEGIYPFTGVKGEKQGHWSTVASSAELKKKRATSQIFPFLSK